eukprot:391654-Pelagomonas_calceolata.AAC.2
MCCSCCTLLYQQLAKPPQYPARPARCSMAAVLAAPTAPAVNAAHRTSCPHEHDGCDQKVSKLAELLDMQPCRDM